MLEKLTRINQNTKMLGIADAVSKVTLEGDYEKQKAELERKIKEDSGRRPPRSPSLMNPIATMRPIPTSKIRNPEACSFRQHL